MLGSIGFGGIGTTFGGSAGGAFSLASVPNIELLIDSDQITGSDGDLLSSIPDFSGNSRTGSAAGSARPTLKIVSGERRIRFDNSDDLVSFGNFMAGTTGFSIFTVWKMNQANGSSIVLSKHNSFGSGGEWAFRLSQSTNVRERTQIETDAKLSGTDKTSISASQNFCVSAVTWAGNEEPKLYTNGVQLAALSGTGWASAANTGATSDPVRLGYAPGFINPSGGDVLDVVLISRKVTDTERANITRYLLHKRFTWQVAFDGDSLTEGSDSGSNPTNYLPHPALDLPLLNARAVGYNFGISGQGLQSIIDGRAAKIDILLDSYYSKRVYVLWAGSNDIAFGGLDGATTYGKFITAAQAAKAAGWGKVVAVTMMPRSDAGVAVGFEAQRTIFNTGLRNNYPTFADILADVAADSRIGDAGDETDTTYYLGAPSPNVHLNNTGAAIAAGIISSAINSA